MGLSLPYRACLAAAAVGALLLLGGRATAADAATSALEDPAYEIASKLMKVGDAAGAKPQLEQLVAKYPASAEAWLLFGTNAEKLNDRGGALNGYLRGAEAGAGTDNRAAGRCREAVLRLFGAHAAPVLVRTEALRAEARKARDAEERKRLEAAAAALDQLLRRRLK